MRVRGAHAGFCAILAVSAMLCNPVAATTTAAQAEAIKDFMQRQDWQGMKNYCGEQISSEPQNFLLHDCICNADTGLGQYELSAKSCKVAGDMAANSAAYRKFAGEDYYHQGFAHLQRGEYEVAKNACDNALKYNPALAEAYMCIGQSDFEPVTKIYMQHVQSSNSDASEYQFSSSERERMQKALSAYRRYTEMKPQDAAGWYNVATAYVFLKKYKEAVSYLEHAFTLNPDYPGIYFAMGFTYYIAGNEEKFLAVYQQARQKAPQQAQTLQAMSALGKTNTKKDAERFRAQLLTMQ